MAFYRQYRNDVGSFKAPAVDASSFWKIRLQKELGGEGRNLWVAAYANDVIGYIPSARVLKEGGYEGGEAFYGSTWPAPLADDIESIVVTAAHDVVKKVRGKGN